MTSTTTYRRGDVVLVPFPFTDLTAAKPRPALVVSTDAYNAAGQDVLIAAITSSAAPPRPNEHRVTRWRAAGLVRPSTVKAVIGTVRWTLIRRRLGRLAETDQQAVDAKLRSMLGL
jgi:mRNA interferase MazF